MATEEPLIDKLVLDPVEDLLDKMGMMQGEYAPVKRAVFGAAVGAAVVWGTHADLFFKGNKLRPWKLLHPNDPDATIFPWYLAVAGHAFVMAVLI